MAAFTDDRRAGCSVVLRRVAAAAASTLERPRAGLLHLQVRPVSLQWADLAAAVEAAVNGRTDVVVIRLDRFVLQPTARTPDELARGLARLYYCLKRGEPLSVQVPVGPRRGSGMIVTDCGRSPVMEVRVVEVLPEAQTAGVLVNTPPAPVGPRRIDVG